MFDEDIELLRKMREDKNRDAHELAEHYKDIKRSYLFNIFLVFSNMFFGMFNALKVGYNRLDEKSISMVSVIFILWFFHMIFYVIGLIGASNDLFKMGKYRRTGRF